jgi:site-specific DNA-methyltransferase (adenine-specific)/adenine-specific DNA-methyltransferase
MVKTLIEELPKITKKGKKEAEKILTNSSIDLTLQTNEYVLPAKDTGGYFKDEIKTIPLGGKAKKINRIN